jgi:hypothetical protein
MHLADRVLQDQQAPAAPPEVRRKPLDADRGTLWMRVCRPSPRIQMLPVPPMISAACSPTLAHEIGSREEEPSPFRASSTRDRECGCLGSVYVGRDRMRALRPDRMPRDAVMRLPAMCGPQRTGQAATEQPATGGLEPKLRSVPLGPFLSGGPRNILFRRPSHARVAR